MTERISIGDEAPNFDLSSTEGALLMLCDEVPRTFVLLYFFDDPAKEESRSDLTELAGKSRDFASSAVKILGVSPSKMPALEALQQELGLPFPLLRDDRGFSASYGIEPPTEDSAAAPALYLVDRRQKVAWMSNPVSSVASALDEIATEIKKQDSPTSNYPRSVINRLVDRWVN